MPFFDLDGLPLDRVPLVYRGGRRFQLTAPFAWVDPRDAERIVVPAHDVSRSPDDEGNSTDLASVPPPLWGLVASYGRQTLPAILHDRLSDDVRRSPATGRVERQEAVDDRFRVALRECGVTDARSTVMWAVVRLAGYVGNAPALGVAMVAQVALSVVVIVAAIVLGAAVDPWYLLALALPGIAALAWLRRAGVVAVGAYAGALYAPMVVSAVAASGLEFVIAGVLYLAGGRRGAPPHPGPLLRSARRSGRS